MSRRTGWVLLLALPLLGGLFWALGRREAVPPSPDTTPETAAQTPDLGPADGRDLPGQDTGRVAVGDAAPDFSLLAHAGDVVTLSDFRGRRNVILAFYRGHW